MRFVFNNPLVWGDELATMVFLWLAMLGSVLALWNGEHMRLTTIASRLPPRWRALADTLAVAAPCLFLAMIISPALGVQLIKGLGATRRGVIQGGWRCRRDEPTPLRLERFRMVDHPAVAAEQATRCAAGG